MVKIATNEYDRVTEALDDELQELKTDIEHLLSPIKQIHHNEHRKSEFMLVKDYFKIMQQLKQSIIKTIEIQFG